MNQLIQNRREEWYRARKAVANNAALDDVGLDHARAHWHMVTRQWVAGMLPLDTVEDHRPGLWHDREIGDYTGLRGALDALKARGAEDPLPDDQLAEIGRAADELTTDLTGLSADPPLDVDPWEPDPPGETREWVNGLIEDTPGLSAEEDGL